MRTALAFLLALPVLIAAAGEVEYKAAADWPRLPAGRAQVGSTHGDVAVSSTGDVYISVMAVDTARQHITDPMAGLQVYANDGTYIRNVANAPDDLHGFVIRKEPAGEFIYGARLLLPGDNPADVPKTGTAEARARTGFDQQAAVKMTLDGRVVQAIPESAFPDRFKSTNPVDGKPYMRLTGLDVAPNGDIYVTDGYLSDYIHRFDRTGRYLASFGGPQAPYNFKTLHQLAIDTRFTPARIIACDRANNRIVHLSLEGQFLGEVAASLLAPADVAISGDYAVIAELRGRITVLDKAGTVVASFGAREAGEEAMTRTTEPSKWRAGVAVGPHGVAVNAHGDVFVSEFTVFGRVLRFNRQ